MEKSTRSMLLILQSLRQAERVFCAAEREALTPAAQWLRDNARSLYSQAYALRGCRALRRQEYSRVRALCADIAQNCSGPVLEGPLCRHLRAWQAEERPLTVRELRALPELLNHALMQRLCGLLPGILRQYRAWQAGEALSRQAAAAKLAALPSEPVTLWRAVELLTHSGHTEAVRRLESRLRERGLSPQQLTHTAQEQLESAAAEVGAVISALLSLPKLNGGRITEKCSAACAVLRQHANFSLMDEESRALYLTAVDRLSRRLRVEETRLCKTTLGLCADQDGAQGDPGFYLLENSAPLCRALGKRPCSWSMRARVRLYIAVLAASAALSAALGFMLLPWYGAVPFIAVGVALAHQLLERLSARLLPRRQLPRLQKLPEGTRALIVVPTVLMHRAHALKMCRQMAVLFCANEKAPADFLLLSDYTESTQVHEDADRDILRAASAGIDALRRTHGARFFYLQRERSYDAANKIWYGYERKRGALALLGALLAGETPNDPIAYSTLDPALFAGRYTHVITLDADTFLPCGACEKLLGAMLHPLQRGRVAVIQPRMLTLPMHVKTHAQLLLGGRSGADAYNAAAADLYQDAFGRGSFMGKGIYEPAAFRAATADLPAGRILSHDLLEGELAGAALASDIVCYDGHPQRVDGFLKRDHRWTRGDWQIASYMFSNKLDALSRLKIWDNLRRSLTPALRMAVLIISALYGAWLPFLLALLPLHSGQDLSALLLLPASALTRLDAVARALWRLCVSHQKLLQWTTAAQAEESDLRALRSALPPMLCGMMLLFAAAQSAFGPGFALGAGWLAYPLITRWMDRPHARRRVPSDADARFLRAVARDTLQFFTRHTNAATHHLPPDNVQLAPPRGAALRTSPTNIGLYLLSLCAARELKLIDSETLFTRMAQTLNTLETLHTWHGIPFNWYDIATLAPLPPRFVSAVDAGNYLACLTAAAQAARLHLDQVDPVLHDVPARLDALTQRMQLFRLYDRRAQLFYVGYDADSARMTNSRYDLWASEAQLLSFMAIANSQAPERHWQRLGRPWTGRPVRAPLSWSGTTFEYLLPALLLPTFEDTAFEAAQRGCVSMQRRAAQNGIWGISESACAQFDPDLNYRYQAFGVRALALNAACAGDVYAPYAAALCLREAPEAACASLRRMQSLGAYGEMGFFEAVDMTGPAPQIVRSHMAHHQGMLLCAICNALCDDHLSCLLLALPRVQARLPLLNDLPPRRVPRLPRPLRVHRDVREEAPLRMRAERGDALLLSGGGNSLLLNDQGNSHFFGGALSYTRFDARLGAVSGPQVYLVDAENAVLRLTAGNALYMDGLARFSNVQPTLRTETDICLDPVTGAAIYAVHLRSTAAQPQKLTLAFYLEPALETLQNDQAHVAFSNLFLSAEQTGESACLLRRRSREGQGERLLHARAYAQEGALRCDMLNDRALFLGREGSIENPLGLRDAAWQLADSTEVCLALRVQVTLPAGRENTLFFALGPHLPDTGEALLHAQRLARTRALVSRRVLGLDARQTALACRMAGRLLYTRDAPAPASIRELWASGISGDIPFLLLIAQGEDDIPQIEQTARLFAFLCESGAQAEMILLLPEESGYEQPLRAFCEGLTLRPPLHALQGRLHLFTALPDGNRQALERLCALCLHADQPLVAQMPAFPERAVLSAAAAGGQLAPMPRLLGWNGLGGFTREGGYTVCAAAPAPWCHILCNEVFGTLVSEQGILYSYAGNSRLRRLTRASQDSVLIEPSEEYLIVENGRAWSLTRRPLQNAACRVTYEMGEAVYQCALPHLQATLRCFADAQYPAGGRILLLRNTGESVRTLQIVGAARFALGEDGRGTFIQAQGDCLLARGGGLEGVAFFYLKDAQALSLSSSAYGVADVRRSLEGPAGSVGVLKREITLRPGESAQLAFFLGHCGNETDLSRLLPHLTAARARAARAAWQERLGRLQFYLPDPMLSGYLNGFLPYQVRAARLQMRAGFYQAGGAWGFRDQLQDMLSLLYTEPERVRVHLLLCAARQYTQGDVQHWWHPEGAGVRTRISDDRLFLPYVTARYVHVTGDSDVLRLHAPYLASPELAESERDRYETPAVTRETGTLMEHCLRAIARMRFGPHGIPLMEGGDWNDGMNRVGGESAWLGFFLIMVLRDFAPLCDEKTQDRLDRQRIHLQNAMQAAWTGRWFLRAWYPDGRTLGAPDSEVPRIDLISQCFACFAGMPRDQVSKALDAAWDALHRKELGVTLLLSPPFTPQEGAGYIGAYRPGVRENGGQYTHAVPWLMRALMMTGQTERAWQLLYECLPYTHSDTPEKARHYRAEPYVLAGDIHLNGRGGWTWYTGSAGWLYEVFLRDFLGFDKRGDGVRLAPRVPPDWEECTVLYHYGASRYQLTAARDVPFVTLDGERITGAYVPLRDDGKMHEARFPLAPLASEEMEKYFNQVHRSFTSV